MGGSLSTNREFGADSKATSNQVLTAGKDAVEWADFAAMRTRSLKIRSDNLCGCSDVIGRTPRNIDEHLEQRYLSSKDRSAFSSEELIARDELKSLILAQIERWRHA